MSRRSLRASVLATFLEPKEGMRIRGPEVGDQLRRRRPRPVFAKRPRKRGQHAIVIWAFFAQSPTLLCDSASATSVCDHSKEPKMTQTLFEIHTNRKCTKSKSFNTNETEWNPVPIQHYCTSRIRIQERTELKSRSVTCPLKVEIY